MLNPFAKIAAVLRRLGRDTSGNVMMIFGLCVVILIIAGGMAVDMGRAYLVKMQLSTALDAAALAVGSEANQTQTQLNTDLQNYFTANYPSNPLSTSVTVTPVPANADLTASVVNYQASATVPMYFMPLVSLLPGFGTFTGFNSVTVTTTAQTKKTTGLEVVLVLDNTGSMLCGPNDGAPAYSDSQCGTGVVSTDTSCTNSSNQSRICQLIQAAQLFVNTMASGITSSEQLYIGVVPYVTTVNVGSSFCSGATSCSHITTEACSGDFSDLRGNIIPVTPVTGNTTSGSTTVSNVSPDTSGIRAGMQITGPGITAGTTVSSVNSTTQITLSASATATGTGVNLTVGTYTAVSTTTTKTPTGRWSAGSNIITNMSSTTGIGVGMVVTSTSAGIPTAPITTVTSVDSSTQIHISQNATVTQASNQPLTIKTVGGTITNGSNIINAVSTATTPTVGMVVSGANIPANSTIVSVDSAAAAYTGGTGQLHIQSPTGGAGCAHYPTATANVPLAFYSPLRYDTTNTNTTSNWMGCVVEPTSSDENTGAGAVLNSASSDPDTSEPSGGWPSWYPFYWTKDSANSWPAVSSQSNTTEIQGRVVSDWGGFPGPNQGCPVPIVPLTDVTSSTGKTTVLNAIGSMWPRDEGGTQVHIGMIWGWRVLSPNGPFTPTNGHPLDYSTAQTTGWKKVVVLMTDGTEEWPAATHLTGLGFLNDGKIDTTSTTTAVTNLNSRLQAVCNAMQSSGDFIIYTIGLGSDGASNAQLQSCPGSTGGQFYAASTTNLQQVFAAIAKDLLALRLSQ
ncbi:MAG TPA: TadE/TadG family type IV pilus assembly protein [Stellaceae bacterium]|nr:TadE/TadG family type IV pilus assembly protein [Stellaceae bacterium]